MAAICNLWFPWQKANDHVKNIFDRKTSLAPSSSKLVDDNEYDSTTTTMDKEPFLPNGDLYLSNKT